MWTIHLDINCGPVHEHDCITCRYLGSATISAPFKDVEVFDLYVHDDPVSPLRTTVIARFGKDGDYHSGLEFGRNAFRNLPGMAYAGAGAMGTAFALAKIAGHDVEPKPYTGE